VHAAAPLPPSRQGEIDVGETRRAALELSLTRFDRVLELALQGVRGSPDLLTLVRLEAREGLQDLSEAPALRPRS
jgi:hypothetical protein